MCLASLIISIKLTDDDTYLNTYYARLGGVTTQEMVRIELEFLKLLNFNAHVTEDEFEKYKEDILKLQFC